MCEKTLLVAMIEKAYQDARGFTTFKNNRMHVTKAAQFWIFSNKFYPCSFIWICDRLNLPYQLIRQKLKEELTMPKKPMLQPKPLMKSKGTPLAGFGPTGPSLPPVMPKKKRRPKAPPAMPMNDMM